MPNSSELLRKPVWNPYASQPKMRCLDSQNSGIVWDSSFWMWTMAKNETEDSVLLVVVMITLVKAFIIFSSVIWKHKILNIYIILLTMVVLYFLFAHVNW